MNIYTNPQGKRLKTVVLRASYFFLLLMHVAHLPGAPMDSLLKSTALSCLKSVACVKDFSCTLNLCTRFVSRE